VSERLAKSVKKIELTASRSKTFLSKRKLLMTKGVLEISKYYTNYSVYMYTAISI